MKHVPRAGRLLLPLMTMLFVSQFGSTGSAHEVVVACGQVVTGHVALANDLVCTNTDGLIVGADGTTIDLNGHRITCRDPNGYKGSCQGPGLIDPDPEVGLDTAGHSDVLLTNNDPKTDGVIDGFDVGVRVSGGQFVNVKNLVITGPPGGAVGSNPRPISQGILVRGVTCPDPPNTIVRVGGGVPIGNDVSNHTEGIELNGANCVNVGHNVVHNNDSDPVACFGIVLTNSSNNNINNNQVFRNGEGLAGDAGVNVQGPGSGFNTLTDNTVNDNRGDGITMRSGAHDNRIVNNVMLRNMGANSFDASGKGAPANFWNFNNVCVTQNGEVPPGVCGPDEGA